VFEAGDHAVRANRAGGGFDFGIGGLGSGVGDDLAHGRSE
jgi:hypothetical protein